MAAQPAHQPQAAAPHPVLDRYYTSSDDRPTFVRTLFDRSARDYDRIDAVASLGTGRWYRRKALLQAGLAPSMRVLDVGCGTGLVALPAADIVGPHGHVLGVDPNQAMRDLARARHRFDVIEGIAESLPVDDAAFDMVTMGYALRHVDDLAAAFSEFARALVPGGRILILEITPPESAPGRAAMKLAMHWLIPALSAGVSFSLDGWRLMRYFWDTIDQCVPPDRVLAAIESAGFQDADRSVELGIFSAYTARKPAPEEGNHT